MASWCAADSQDTVEMPHRCSGPSNCCCICVINPVRRDEGRDGSKDRQDERGVLKLKWREEGGNVGNIQKKKKKNILRAAKRHRLWGRRRHLNGSTCRWDCTVIKYVGIIFTCSYLNSKFISVGGGGRHTNSNKSLHTIYIKAAEDGGRNTEAKTLKASLVP